MHGLITFYHVERICKIYQFINKYKNEKEKKKYWEPAQKIQEYIFILFYLFIDVLVTNI